MSALNGPSSNSQAVISGAGVRGNQRRAVSEVLERRLFLTAIVVNSTADMDSTGTVTLRDAIEMADANPGTSSNPDIITFQADITGTITLNSSLGALSLDAGYAQINGPGIAALTVSGGGVAGGAALLDVVGGANAVISGLTIANGNNAGGYGGGIYLGGATLAVNNCNFSGDSAGNVRGGGGIFADYGSTVLAVNDCTFSNDSATAGVGGAILNNGSTTVSNSTFIDNSAGNGGGACDDNANALTVVNCTFEGNTAGTGGGGALANYLSGTTVVVSDSSIVGNTASGGAGGIEDNNSFTLNNTIVAENTVATVESDVSAPLTTPSGYDFIGDGSGGLAGINGNILGTKASPIDPLLHPLAPNGGPTRTLLPASSSPVINAGSVALIPMSVTTDQRGLPRTVNGAVDIGAVEVGGTAVSNPAAKLAFVQEPANELVGATLNPVILDVETASGAIASADNSSVTLSVSGASGGTLLGGTTTVAAVNGVATFSNLTLNATGVYTLIATDGALTGATSDGFTISSTSTASPPEKIGGPDLSFGTNGFASHDVGFVSADGVGVDGSQAIIIGTIGIAPDESFGATRYNANGSLDTTFGTGGVVSTTFGSTDDVPAAVDVLGNGDILVAGTATTYAAGTATGSEFAVAEYTPNGLLNTGFGGGTGKAFISFSTTTETLTNDVLKAMVVGANGLIYLGGSSGSDFAIAALTASGTIPAFGSGGKVLQSFASGSDVINSLALQANGDIVAAGSASIAGVTRIALARFLPSGLLDKHFGVKGLVTTSMRGVYDSASSVVIQNTGQVVVGGVSATGTGASLSSDFAVTRYTSAGHIDKTFGGGSVITSFGQPSAITQLILQGNGQIIASGKTTPSLSGVTPDELDIAIARYTVRGTLDTTFDGTGKTIVDLGSGVVTAASVQTGSLFTLAIEPSDTSGLGSAFDAFLGSNQGAVSATPGGEILDAGNSGSSTIEAEIITAGVDLTTSLLSQLPAATTGGMKGTATVNIEENGTSTAAGSVTIELTLAIDAQGDGATVVKSLPEKINLREQRSRNYRIAFVYPASVTAGSYYLVADVLNGSSPALKDLNAENNLSASKAAVDIAPAFISLTGSSLSAGSTFTSGKTAVVIFTITNDGNTLAKGATTVDIILSADQTPADGARVDQANLMAGLPAEKSRVYRLRFKLPETIAAGTYYLISVIDPADSLGSIDRSDSNVVDPTKLLIG